MTFNVCFVFDHGYIEQFKVTSYSLIVNNRESTIFLHLLTHGLFEADKEDIQAFLHKMGAEAAFYEIDESVFGKLPKMNDRSYATYYKLLIPSYLSHLDSVLYLDCDVIVCKSVAKLFSSNDEEPLSAVEDRYVLKRMTAHAKKISEKYFNAGVLFFRFAGRKHPNLDEMLDYAEKNSERLLFHDQDILNFFYADNFCPLDKTYNTFSIYYHLLDVFYDRHPTIVHYTDEKPWKENYINKYHGLYRKYYKACSEMTHLGFYQKRKRLFRNFFAKYCRSIRKLMGKTKTSEE